MYFLLSKQAHTQTYKIRNKEDGLPDSPDTFSKRRLEFFLSGKNRREAAKDKPNSSKILSRGASGQKYCEAHGVVRLELYQECFHAGLVALSLGLF